MFRVNNVGCKMIGPMQDDSFKVNIFKKNADNYCNWTVVQLTPPRRENEEEGEEKENFTLKSRFL